MFYYIKLKKTGKSIFQHLLFYSPKSKICCKDKACLVATAKPEKIFLNNSTIMYALSSNDVEIGRLREVFFFNQLSVNQKLIIPQRVIF